LSDLLFVVRALHMASTTIVAGALLFAFFVSEPVLCKVAVRPLAPRLRRLLTVLAWSGLGLALVSGAAWLVLLSAEIAGQSLSATLKDGVAGTVFTQTQFGRAWQARLALGGLLAVALLLDRAKIPAPRIRLGIAAALAAALMASLAWAGHGAADEGVSGDIHLLADVLHLTAAAAWLGALVPLAYVFVAAFRSDETPDLHVAADITRRFSTLGLISVGTLLITGVINTWFLAGDIPALVGTDYGRLLLIKIALFAAMVGVASVNRQRLTPRLTLGSDRARAALLQLARNSVIETGLGLIILVIVGRLGAIPPALHLEPVWPFPLRLDAGVFSAPDTRGIAIAASLAAGAALLLIVAGIMIRRWRWATVLAGILLALVSVRSFASLAVPAFPTTYLRSPTGYTTTSIAHGKALFTQHCAACHGPDARGHGPLAKQPGENSADLTADHIYAHTDGDLFWWISHGIGDVMPGVAGEIDDDGRWNMVDFVHANADAVRLRAGVAARFPTPDFTADCSDGSTIAIGDLHQIVHLVIAAEDSLPRLHALAHSHIAHEIATVVIPSGELPAGDLPFCLARDASVLSALAVYAGKDPAASEGTEFLVDAAGQLQATWQPGMAPDVTVLQQAIAKLANAPASPRPASLHIHSH
jgi:putative copper export protein/mono/diheme cytochrome c family protein